MTTSIPLSQITLPGHRAPGAGFEAPFEMLDACHERVHRMLALLVKLQRHIADEDGTVYPAAQAQMGAQALQAMSADMMHRRGLELR